MSAEILLVVLLLFCLLGMMGQAIRVVAGIKNRSDEATHSDLTIGDVFDPRTLVVRLFIGFVARNALVATKTWSVP